MPQPEASADLYRTLQRLQLVVVMAGRRAWSRMTPNFDQSWAGTSPGLLTVTTAAQLAAAQSATEYVPALLEETGQRNAPEARVQPRAFAGVAADGRTLPGLLQSAVVRSKEATRTRAHVDPDGYRRVLIGKSPEQALAEGGRWLDSLLQTAVADAARAATQAEAAVREGFGFVRRVNPPCCGRCAILAGRWYPYDAGFKRHPGCDCSVEVSTEDHAHMLITNPDDLFSNGLVHGLTKRERDRLAAGDDVNKVINESRDMWRARLSDQRRKDKDAAKAAETGALPPTDAAARDRTARQGLEDLFASTRNRTEALSAMKAQGYIA